MARSMTSVATRAAITLIAAISVWAAFFPTVSIIQAVFSVSSRTCSICILDSAMRSRTTPWSASGFPTATRVGLRVGDPHEHRDLAARVERTAREPLVTIDHIVVAVGLDSARDVRRVGRRNPRLGHREARTDLAFEQRREPLLLLEGGAE